ncbi:oxygenase MpaB family protein [Trueperella bernardiae]
MAGVAGHSEYQDDPWGRLQRTADYVAMTTFARNEGVKRMISHVRSIQ